MMSTTSDESEEFEVECFCGKPAQLRKSHTAKNPGRLFYNCPKRRGKQCKFFLWRDELNSPTGSQADEVNDQSCDEVNQSCHECIQLPSTPMDDCWTDEVNQSCHGCIQLDEKLNEIQQQHDKERIVWNMQKSVLISELSSVKAELDDVKERTKMPYKELDFMPLLTRFPMQNHVGTVIESSLDFFSSRPTNKERRLPLETKGSAMLET